MLRRRIVTALPALLASLAGVPSVGHAQTAERVTPDTLAPEGGAHLLDVAVLGQFTTVVDPSYAGDMQYAGSALIRSRFEIGKTLAYAGGLDAELGGSNRGLVGNVTAYPVGIAVRWGSSGVVSLEGGAGVDGATDAIPLAARFPAELEVGVPIGPVRPVLWLRPAWVVGAPARRDGSSLSFVDELDTGILLRLGAEPHYWSTVTAGGGFAIGFAYRQFLGTSSLGVTLGFDFTEGR